MEKRIILAIFLMLIVAVLPSILFPPKKPADGRSGGQARGGTTAQRAPGGPAAGALPAPPPPRACAARDPPPPPPPSPPARRLCRNRVGHVPDLPPGLQHAGRGARERGAVGIPLVHPRGLWGGPRAARAGGPPVAALRAHRRRRHRGPRRLDLLAGRDPRPRRGGARQRPAELHGRAGW